MITIKQLAEKLKVSQSFIHTYSGRPEINKYFTQGKSHKRRCLAVRKEYENIVTTHLRRFIKG